MEKTNAVWTFHGAGAQFTSGVFSSLEAAEDAIHRFGLSGMLTKYPVDTLIYPWAIRQGIFTAKKPEQESADFIGRFTSASQEHYHYEGGVRA